MLVRYGERHNPHLEWVQNEADLEEARVVWAREMDRARTAALLREFPERRPWLLHADRRPQVPIPYELDEKR